MAYSTATDSTHRGILEGTAQEAVDVTDILRLYLAAISGLDPTKVRRRWMPKMGVQPTTSEDWAAVGILSIASPGTPLIKRTGAEQDIKLSTHQILKCQASFYGPNAVELSDRFRAGALVGQANAWLEKEYGLTLIRVEDEIVQAPDLIGEVWVPRFDVNFSVGRNANRVYKIRTIVGFSSIEIYTEKDEING